MNNTEKLASPRGCLARLVRLLFGGGTAYERPLYIPAPPKRRLEPCPFCGAKMTSVDLLGTSRKGRVHADRRVWKCGTMIRRDFFREVEVKIGADCEPNAKLSNPHPERTPQ